ncbi:MAG TPA: hypothetical protein VMN57_10425 [Anaerolineales bacterium]|nr:hypothetical protein [Anaerolineales bacterium]
MRIVTNETHIRKYARAGQITSLAGLLLLVAGLVISFVRPEQVPLSLAALLLGFALSQVGIFLGNRYARSPRADQALNAALKGVDRQHTLYHYIAPTPHFLAGPTGMWILIPKPQRGRITYEKRRWRQRGGVFLSYLRIFAQEGIGRPDLEIGAEIDTLKKFLKKELPELEFPDPNPVLVFTNPRAEIAADDAPVPTVPISVLKHAVRDQAKQRGGKLSPEQLAALTGILEAGISE